MTAEAFAYDVFLSHSAKDKSTVRALAERFKADGLRVWFDEWEIQIGDSIPAKLELGLEHSRILLLCMSANAFDSDWAMLESQTFRFRDPLNKERRFIPVRIDNTEPRGSLAQFRYVDWREGKRDEEYPNLVAACQLPSREITPSEESTNRNFSERIISLGHTGYIRSVAFSPDGRRALSASDDYTVRLWDIESGCCLRVFEGHTDCVWSVAFSSDGRRALSGADDTTLKLWDLSSDQCVREFRGHTDRVLTVAFSVDGRYALSGSADKSVRLWDVESGQCLRALDGHADWIRCVAFSIDGRYALSGSDDQVMRQWDVESGQSVCEFLGHTDRVLTLAFSIDGRYALSGSADKSVRLWDLSNGHCLRVLQGHTNWVMSVVWGADGRHLLSGSHDKTLRLWEVESGNCVRVLECHTDRVLSVALSSDGRYALSGAGDKSVRLWDLESGRCLRTFEGHNGRIHSVAWSSDGRHALSCSADRTLRLWELESGNCVRVLKSHTDAVVSVAFNSDGRRALSASGDKTLRLWDLRSGHCVRMLKGNVANASGIAFSQDGRHTLSCADDHSVRLWDVQSRRCLRMLKGHTGNVVSVAFSSDGLFALSGSVDRSLRLWNLESGNCMRIFNGHGGGVASAALSADGHYVVSGSHDNCLRLWDLESGNCLRVLEGHTGRVSCLAYSPDGHFLLSGSNDATLRLWDVESGSCLGVLQGHTKTVVSVAWTLDGQTALSTANNGVLRIWNLRDLVARAAGSPATVRTSPAQLHYTNAKVLLVGESGVGKTGLSKRLAMDDWQPSDSTVGAWATQWNLTSAATDSVEREIWLWDFGGQADQRLIHQLYMDETALAVLVFDGQKEDLFETLGQWDRDMTRASRQTFTKLLAAGRVDAGGLRVSRHQLDAFAKERGFACVLETSAKSNLGCEELKRAIVDGIRWEDIPWRSSPVLFKQLKDEIIKLRESGRVLMRFNELRDNLQLILTSKGTRFTDAELKAVVSLLAGPGVVWELQFGNWVLLHPEYVNAYGQAVIQTLRADPEERGCLSEEIVLKGELKYQSSMQRLPADEERFVLLAMHQTLVERGLCLREHTDGGPQLIFPSFFRRERPDLVGHPAVFVSYQFNGFLDDIYATLVVRLHHTQSFDSDELWRYAADFKTLTHKQLGVKLTRRSEGAGELELYFDPGIPAEEKIIFTRYVHDHLLDKANELTRLRHYVCPHCGTPVGNREVAMKRLSAWLEGRPPEAQKRGANHTTSKGVDAPTILCAECEQRVPLWDDLEECFASPSIRERVSRLRDNSTTVLDNESKERVLVGEVISTVALAGQISREKSVSDHGIDMEIEFKDDRGEASGEMLFLQLKSGDSYLRRQHMRDDTEVFTIKEERHTRYWMNQKFPVMLVIRASDGTVRWMEVRDWLRRATKNGTRSVSRIDFQGERFDVMSVRRWRERLLANRLTNE